MDRREAYTLYLCHALSTWNARSYEYAAVLFTTAAYPGGLQAASFIGISTSLAAICFGPALGRWIDHASSRLRALLTTIVVNRVAAIFACIIWMLIVNGTGPKSSSQDNTSDSDDLVYGSILQGTAKTTAFMVLLCLGIIENLSRKANVISIERDWVPLLAPDTVTERFSLAVVNATMARIDVVCKMAAPIVISWLFSIISVNVGIRVIAVLNTVSLSLEWMTAKSVWTKCDSLKQEKSLAEDATVQSDNRQGITWRKLIESIAFWFFGYVEGLRLYFGNSVWPSSMAMCIKEASILSITGVTVVFLLNSGYSLQLVTVGQTMSALFELGSTFVTPIAVSRMVGTGSKGSNGFFLLPQEIELDQEEEQVEVQNEHHQDSMITALVNTAITKIGFWGIVGMSLTLLPSVPILLYLTLHLKYPITQSELSPTFSEYPFVTVVLFFCLASSRMGRGIFTLATQQLAQSQVPPHQRSSFAGTEQAFISIFGLLHNLGTAIWSRPEEFGWLAFGSFMAVSSGACLYTSWWLRNKKGGLSPAPVR